jgi:hypothetical protein
VDLAACLQNSLVGAIDVEKQRFDLMQKSGCSVRSGYGKVSRALNFFFIAVNFKRSGDMKKE